MNAPGKGHIETSSRIMIEKEEEGPLWLGTCWLLGQSSGERKVVEFNPVNSSFRTVSSRVRIPTPKIKMEAIEILYEESQEILLPDMFAQTPKPPFNSMMGVCVKKDVIFLCGGTVFEKDYVSIDAFFYTLVPRVEESKEKQPIVMKRFEPTSKMHYARYEHMGVFRREKNDGVVYVFGGRNSDHECMASC